MVKRYCEEVYNSALPPYARRPAGIPLGILAQGVARFLRERPGTPKRAEGPLSALMMALDKAGWRAAGPFEFICKKGRSFHLLTVGPHRVVSAFRKDLQQALIHRGMEKIHKSKGTSESQELLEKGVFFAPIRNVYRRLDAMAKRVLIKLVTGGTFTKSFLLSIGYDIDPVCDVCGEACDDVVHRGLTCCEIEGRAISALGVGFHNELVLAGSGSLKSRLLFPMPDMLSSPSSVTLFETIGLSEGDTMVPADGEVFGDGCCLCPSNSPLARTGFSIVQVCPLGNVRKAIYGCVPASQPQTSLAGEYAAFLVASENCRNATYIGDCADVLSMYSMGLGTAMASYHAHADVWRMIDHRVGGNLEDRISAVAKVKSHVSLAEVTSSGGDVLRYWGNFHADAYARLGAELHQASSVDVCIFKTTKNNIKNLAYHVVDALNGLSARGFNDGAKAPRLSRELPVCADEGSDESHQFAWIDKMWVCTKCFVRSRFPCRLPKPRLKCNGISPFSCFINDSKGHSIWCASTKGGGCIFYCTKCWSYASAYPRRLALPCEGLHDNHGLSSVRFYLKNRQHPISKARLLHPVCLHA